MTLKQQIAKWLFREIKTQIESDYAAKLSAEKKEYEAKLTAQKAEFEKRLTSLLQASVSASEKLAKTFAQVGDQRLKQYVDNSLAAITEYQTHKVGES